MNNLDYNGILARSREEWRIACSRCSLPECNDTDPRCPLVPVGNPKKATGRKRGRPSKSRPILVPARKPRSLLTKKRS